MIRKILISTDFSNLSRRALGYTAKLAHKVQAELLGTHAVTLPGPIYSHFAEAERRFAELEAILQKRLEQFFRHPSVRRLKVETRLTLGVPEEAVNHLASNENVDLSVVAKHSRSGVERFLVGSVAERIVRESPCPVLVVPASRSLTVRWSPMVCAVDFSDTAMEALNFAARFAGDYGADLTVIHVVEVDPVHVLTDVKFKKFAASLMREAEARLSEMLSTSGVPTKTKALVKQGKPQAIVEDLIQRTGCDLLVAGTRGMHLPRQGGIGSTANAFLRSVPVPVLLVP